MSKKYKQLPKGGEILTPGIYLLPDGRELICSVSRLDLCVCTIRGTKKDE